ncbi:MAG: septal ring lytic transglycosylase RlpA family protein [bacterium]|nr:septal ring lytic transglycosylase RlpA family protein [bacterium]
MRTRFPALCLLLALLSASLLSCAPPPPEDRSVRQNRNVQYGKASHYGTGDGFHGNKTASGEVFDRNQLTAAHRTLPFGTLCRVTNLSNGRSVVVRINDRGPFVKGRIIDLSWAAAKRIGSDRAGVVDVKVEVLKRGGGTE